MRLRHATRWLLVGIALAVLVGVPIVATGASAAQPTRIYVTNYLDNTASILNGRDNAVVATVRVGRAPAGIAVSPDRRSVYIANSGSDTVSVLDSASNRIVGTIALPRG